MRRPVKYPNIFVAPNVVLGPHRGKSALRSPVTVCVATIFTWTYTPGDRDFALLTSSDRMITAADIEWEPPQLKTCFLTSKINILISGDYRVHSEAIKSAQRYVASYPEATVADVEKKVWRGVRRDESAGCCTCRTFAPWLEFGYFHNETTRTFAVAGN